MNFYLLDLELTNGLPPMYLIGCMCLAIISGVLVITTKNPIVSVLFLISLFLVISINLIMVGLHFIGLAYLLVYIGAIAILFLFILMLINIRIAELTSFTANSLPLAFIFSMIIYYTLSSSAADAGGLDIEFCSSNRWDGNLVHISHISSLGNVLYSSYAIWLMIVGFILLLAMVGSIIILIPKSSPLSTKGLPKRTFISNCWHFLRRASLQFIYKYKILIVTSFSKNTKDFALLRRAHSYIAPAKGSIFRLFRPKGRSFSTISPVTSFMQLNPWFISGFADAESCFCIGIRKNNKLKTGWRVEANFSIGLHHKDLALLESIRLFLGVGNISKDRQDYIRYQVTSVKDLPVIITHFEKFLLLTQKQADYILFKQAMKLILSGEHLTVEGFRTIVSIRASMNNGLSDELKSVFPDIIPFPRPVVEFRNIPDPSWIAGLASGEACFFIGIQNTLSGTKVSLKFQITQHLRDEQIMNSLGTYLGCGRYIVRSKAQYSQGDFIVSRLSDHVEKIIPYFKKYPILGDKSQDFADFCKAAELLKSKAHLTEEGLEQIREIKAGMNTGRK